MTVTPATTGTGSIVLLGTAGGPRQHRDRHSPSNALPMEDGLWIVDTGHAVARQILAARFELPSIRRIFITHHHSDHVMDLGALLLLAWETGLDHEVEVVGPPGLQAAMDAQWAAYAVNIDMRTFGEGRADIRKLVTVTELTGPAHTFERAGVTVHARTVVHPPLEVAFGYRFDTPAGSIAISGDTAPCDGLLRLAEGVDVLVNEVSHRPSLESLGRRVGNASSLADLLATCHTPHDEVGRVATSAGVRTLVLTHFVPADPDLVPTEEWRGAAAERFAGEVHVGKDLDHVRYGGGC
jgi:ribonuclease BN (tRNA processing enzyme)